MRNFVKHGAAVVILALFIFMALGSGTMDEAAESEKEPQTAQEYFMRGAASFGDRAIADFTEAIRLDPNFADAYSYRGTAYYRKGDFDRAIADYTETLRLTPNVIYIYYWRGNAYSNKKDYDRAIADYDATLRLDPNHTDAIEKRTESIAQRDRAAKAEADRKALEAANRYDPAKFILVPANFKPANYTKADLFTAVATAEKLQAAVISGSSYYSPSRDFVSDVVFVSQNGTDINFRTADNAISKYMKVDSRTGLSAGQRVRIYYRAYRIDNWQVIAIERL